MTIEEKLNTLAEFYAQKDLLELDKKRLLEDVQIPAEIEQIVSASLRMAQQIETDMRARISTYNKTIDAEIEAVIIPDELRKALADLDEQRAELMQKFEEVGNLRQEIAEQKYSNEAVEIEAAQEMRDQLRAEVEAKTAKVYADVAKRKQDIEFEFSGKAEDVSENIKKLEAEIKADMKQHAAEKLAANPKSKDLSVKGNFFHAVYVKARKTWIPAKLDDYTETHPDIKNCYTEGEPSVTIRKVG